MKPMSKTPPKRWPQLNRLIIQELQNETSWITVRRLACRLVPFAPPEALFRRQKYDRTERHGRRGTSKMNTEEYAASSLIAQYIRSLQKVGKVIRRKNNGRWEYKIVPKTL